MMRKFSNEFMKNNRIKDLFVLELIFLFIGIYIGPIISDDSLEYISGSSYRAGLYPVFLKMLSLMGGLSTVCVVQNLLVGYSTWLLAGYYIDKYKNSENKVLYKVIVYSSILYTYLFVSIATNILEFSAILTEGLSYPFYIFFLFFFLRFLETNNKKYALVAWLWITLCVLVRRQLLVFLFVAVFIYVLKKKKVKTFFVGFLSIVVSLIISQLFINVYEYKAGFLEEKYTSLDASTITDLVFFANEEDIKLMDDDQALLFKIVLEDNKTIGYSYDILSENYSNMRLEYERESLFLPACFCLFNDGRLYEYIDAVRTKYDLSYNGAVKKTKSISREIALKCVLNHPLEYVNCYLNRFIHSISRTIVPCPAFVNHNSIFIYLYICGSCFIMAIYICFLFFDMKSEYVLFNIYLLLSIFANNFVISLFHSVEPRYFAYNTGVFFVMLLINIKNIVGRLTKK